MGSRIISVANTYDNRVYRIKNGTVEKAFEIIEEETGLKYDAMAVHHLHKYANEHPKTKTDRNKEVSVFELEPGMKLASGIFSGRGAKLLPLNTVLTGESIERIARYNTLEPIKQTVFIKGSHQ